MKYFTFQLCGVLVSVLILLNACNQSEKKRPEAGNIPVEDSLVRLTEMIHQQPLNHQLFERRAAALAAKGETAKAIEDMERALSLDSLIPDYYIKTAEYNLTLGKSEKSKVYLDKCVSLFPDNTDGLLKLAEIHLLVRQYREAMELIVRAQRINTLIAQPYFLKGVIYLELQDTLQSIENFQLTVNRDPYQYHAYMMLGSIYSAKGDSLALDYFRLSSKLKPESIEPWYHTGMFYQNSANYYQAIAAYQMIIDELDPGYEYAYYNIGYIHLEYLRNYTESIDFFNKTTEINKNYFQAYHNRGFAFEQLGRFDLARADYQRVLAIIPNYPLSVEALNRLDQKEGLSTK
jgi:tetratricopeptide (TPR) repeat protein